MNVSLALVATCGVLVGTGVFLMLERSLTRVLVGLVLLSNGVNVGFMVASGEPGAPVFYGSADPAAMADPLPQALVLTAIVITLGTTAFLLAMAHRSWQLHGHDEVQDDVEDAAIRRRANADETSQGYDLDDRQHTSDRPEEDHG
ncbi:MAG: Na(+)/H(+) antiporter subunit C [Actinobacteria bacterium]|nr:Na(+)/H(+) antiporter subunit C [Actinomycetota bacterium]